MIKVIIEVQLTNGTTIQFEKETYGIAGSYPSLDAEKAQELLLEGYHKIKKGIESQK
jgi:hypothetical protein